MCFHSWWCQHIFSFCYLRRTTQKKEKTKQKNKNERKQNIRMWFAQIARTQTIFCSLFSPIRWWSRNARNFVFFRFIFDETVSSSHSIRVRLAVTLFEACVRIWNFRRNIGRPLRRRVSPNADNCQSIETWHNSNVRFFFSVFSSNGRKWFRNRIIDQTHIHTRDEKEKARTQKCLFIHWPSSPNAITGEFHCWHMHTISTKYFSILFFLCRCRRANWIEIHTHSHVHALCHQLTVHLIYAYRNEDIDAIKA